MTTKHPITSCVVTLGSYSGLLNVPSIFNDEAYKKAVRWYPTRTDAIKDLPQLRIIYNARLPGSFHNWHLKSFPSPYPPPSL